MTADVSLDHRVRIRQSLSELTYRARQISKQVQIFQSNNAKQILGLSRELNKSRKQPRKFVPLYDRDKFLQWNENTLSHLNKILLRIFLEIRLYEEKLQSYQSTIRNINSEVAHG